MKKKDPIGSGGWRSDPIGSLVSRLPKPLQRFLVSPRAATAVVLTGFGAFVVLVAIIVLPPLRYSAAEVRPSHAPAASVAPNSAPQSPGAFPVRELVEVTPQALCGVAGDMKIPCEISGEVLEFGGVRPLKISLDSTFLAMPDSRGPAFGVQQEAEVGFSSHLYSLEDASVVPQGEAQHVSPLLYVATDDDTVVFVPRDLPDADGDPRMRGYDTIGVYQAYLGAMKTTPEFVGVTMDSLFERDSRFYEDLSTAILRTSSEGKNKGVRIDVLHGWVVVSLDRAKTIRTKWSEDLANWSKGPSGPRPN